MPDQVQDNLELLLEVSRLLSSKLDLSDLLTTVMQLSARVVGAEQASLLLVDRATNELYFDVALGLDPAIAKIRLKMGQGIAGWVAQNARPLIINDARSDPRWSPKMDEQSGFVTRSILAAPMLLKDEVVGVVEAINHVEGPFTVQDLRNFEAFASQSAVAIENARLFSSVKAEKQNMEAIFTQMREAAILTDASAKVVVANEMARRMLSAAPQRLLGDGLEGLELKPPLEEILKGGEVVAVEVSRERPKPLVLAGSAIRLASEKGADGRGWIWLFRDVTEERRAEGLKRDFLSLISHKLKTPLASITGYSQILLQDDGVKKLPDFPRKALGSIQTQGQKLSELVEKLLSFVTLENMDAGRLQRRTFPLQDAAKLALEALKDRLAGAEVKVEGAAQALGDPDLVKEVFKNLVDNAVKFNTGASKRISIWLRENPVLVEAAVADNGPGIPPEDIEKIFQMFHQVETSFTGQVEGWGLGLPFSQRVLERLGGTLSIDSTLGQGTTVTFTLPRGKA